MGLIQEFKEFAVKGNAIDMAVGLVIGAAFGKIVTSLVNDVIMPPTGYLLGGVDFKNLKVVLKEAADPKDEVALRYGLFLNTIIDFLIVAFTIFIVLKAMNRLMDARKLIPGRRGAPSA